MRCGPGNPFGRCSTAPRRCPRQVRVRSQRKLYANLVAYILQMNDYAAGETPLTTGDGTTLR